MTSHKTNAETRAPSVELADGVAVEKTNGYRHLSADYFSARPYGQNLEVAFFRLGVDPVRWLTQTGPEERARLTGELEEQPKMFHEVTIRVRALDGLALAKLLVQRAADIVSPDEIASFVTELAETVERRSR